MRANLGVYIHWIAFKYWVSYWSFCHVVDLWYDRDLVLQFISNANSRAERKCEFLLREKTLKVCTHTRANIELYSHVIAVRSGTPNNYRLSFEHWLLLPHNTHFYGKTMIHKKSTLSNLCLTFTAVIQNICSRYQQTPLVVTSCKKNHIIYCHGNVNKYYRERAIVTKREN